MCFSAGASFTAGAFLTVAGAATFMEARKPSQKLFGAIPLIFGIQQLAEGCLWLTLQNGDHFILQKISTYIFLTSAVILWPVMIPLSVLLMEEKGKRRMILKILLGTGIALLLYYAYFLYFRKITPQILDCHIFYRNSSPHSLMLPTFLIYLTVTLTPLFISSMKRMYLLGILMLLSCVVAVIFYTKFVTSVWCFFAAVISIVIFWILRGMNRTKVLIGSGAQRQEGS
jgi:hypothetical protein